MKTYCKENKVRFEYKTNDGFVGSWLIPYRAGMERNMATGELISIPIKEIGKKRVYYQFICHPNGDIEFGQHIKTEFLKSKRV
jgi:hypothetical protein